MEEAPESGMESSHSAHANGINESSFLSKSKVNPITGHEGPREE